MKRNACMLHKRWISRKERCCMRFCLSDRPFISVRGIAVPHHCSACRSPWLSSARSAIQKPRTKKRCEQITGAHLPVPSAQVKVYDCGKWTTRGQQPYKYGLSRLQGVLALLVDQLVKRTSGPCIMYWHLLMLLGPKSSWRQAMLWRQLQLFASLPANLQQVSPKLCGYGRKLFSRNTLWH